MIESLSDVLSEQAIGFGIAGTFWLASLLFPFRRLDSRPEIVWDAIGVMTAIAFAWLADFLLAMPVHRLLTATWLSDWYGFLKGWHWTAVIAAYIVLADLGAYWAHRALHSPVLWTQHAWHHSSKYLYWASGLRGSFFDTLVLFVPYALAYALFPRSEAGLAGIALLILHVANQHYIHSNIAVPFTRQLELVFVMSRYHFVHHNVGQEEGNSNFGFIFTGWDRLFGTYTKPDEVPRDAPLGLGYATSNWRLLLGLPAESRSDVPSDRAADSLLTRRPDAS